MNKKYFVSLILIFVFFRSYSQYHYGVKFGINSNTQRYSSDLNVFNNTLGYMNAYHIGLASEYNFSSRFGLAGELLYEIKGTHYNKTEIYPGFTHKLSYLALPVILDYNVVKSLVLQGGVEAGYLLKTQDNLKDINGFLDDIDQFNRLEFSGIVGLKYNLPANVYLSIRYLHGITPFNNIEVRNEDGNSAKVAKSFNKTYQLSVGYNIR